MILQVVTQLHQGPARHSRIALKGGEFPSFNSLCGSQLLIRSRSPTRRSRSVDFLEYVLPSEDAPQLGCKITGGKPFWRNLRFWQRHKKKGVACYTVAPSPQHPDFRSASRRHKAKRLAGSRTTHREALGPIYSDGSSIVPGQMSKQQIPCPVIIAPLPSKSDGKLCSYMPLNRSQRIPSGPLYLP